MSDLATVTGVTPSGASLLDRKTKKRSPLLSGLIFVVVILCGVGFIGFHVAKDLQDVTYTSVWPYVLLCAALLIAMGFEFVNGFHDTANAVATVIYTHSLAPNTAVVLSGLCNLVGVLTSTGTVAFSVLALLPVDLIMQVRSNAGYAMVFALLIGAIVWNVSTWYLGLPSSSSHTMIGAIIGVGIANQLMSLHAGTSGIDWDQAYKVFRALLISPLVGFTSAALLFLVTKRLVKYPELYQSPKQDEPPPWPIRLLLVLTCSGVSFTHGSNDGQKGMGLIMLILIGTVPTAYALNHSITGHGMQQIMVASEQAAQILGRHASVPANANLDEHVVVGEYIRSKQLKPETVYALEKLVEDVNREVSKYPDLRSVPANQQSIVRNGMYVTSEAIGTLLKSKTPALTVEERTSLADYKSDLDGATRFIPQWVKVAVALALGLGTMIGWRRTVVTVGEKIGKSHLTYAQGACAQFIAMVTISAADIFGLPVSTTHVLSSGVAGTMAANRSGLQATTIRNIAAAWVLTLPASALLSGILFWIFRHIVS